MTRAKFVCNSITQRKHWDGTGRYTYSADLTPVMAGSEENKKFFEATPSGSLTIGTFKENIFTPGKEYYLDFTEAN